MKNVFLETGNVMAFRDAMATVEDMERGQPGLAVVWGQAGRGKTEASREYAVRTGAVYLRVLEGWTERGMLAALCKELNGLEPASIDRCRYTAFEALEGRRQTILVDEADRLRTTGHLEHFRDINEITGAPVVFIGEESLYSRLYSRRRIWSRVSQTVRFEPVSTEDVMLFGFKAASLKIDPDAAVRLVGRADGDFRLVWLDVRDLERICRANRLESVDAKMIGSLPERKPGPRMMPKKNGGRQ